MAVRNKSTFWKAVFLLALFTIGILIGFNMNSTRMELIQNHENNQLVLDELKECCSFEAADGSVKACKAISSYGCSECIDFCSKIADKGLTD